MNKKLFLPKDKISQFCQRYHVQRLSVFGSALGDDFRSDSDIDVLVEFEPGHTPGLAFFRMESELSILFGRKVELYTKNFLSRYFRDNVLREAEIQYVKSCNEGLPADVRDNL